MAKQSLLELIAGAKIYDLGQPYWPGMPVHPFDPPFQFYLYRYHEYTEKDLGKIEPGFGDAISLMITSMHAGTHFDLPIHMSMDYKVQGIDVREYQRDTGFVDLPEPLHSMESVPPLLLRAVLFDIPRLHRNYAGTGRRRRARLRRLRRQGLDHGRGI